MCTTGGLEHSASNADLVLLTFIHAQEPLHGFSFIVIVRT